jgi:diaminopimelate epimerase
MTARRFIKMHGLGNDFVVLDARRAPLGLSGAQVRAIADRRTGVGCDQLIVLEPSHRADAFMRIRNADGSEVTACGNAARCVGRVLMDEKEADTVLIETASGIARARDAGDGLVSVDMGAPRTGWRDIPLSQECDTLHLRLSRGALADPVAVSMGNPHAVFFVADAESVALAELGPSLETDPLFPERANISVAQVTSPESLRLRVWERGAGLTRACGTGACAAVVAAHRRGLIGRRATVALDGGELAIDWREDDHVWMTGPAATSFSGELNAGLLP